LQLFRAVARCDFTQQRISAVGNGNIGAGEETGQPGQPVIDRADGSRPQIEPGPHRLARQENCGAMSQQRGNSGNQSAPQKFVRLVGCRDSAAQAQSRVRPIPTKR
jgi:hypothetical protein